MIEGAEQRGELRPGMSVVEYSGGSTGSSLAFVCAVKGYPLRVVTSDAFAREKLRTMEAFGAELIIVPSEGGRITPHLIPSMMEEARAIDETEAREMARRLAREEGVFTGVSSGLNVVAALQLAQELGPGQTVVTVAVDTGLKYLAGDLFE